VSPDELTLAVVVNPVGAEEEAAAVSEALDAAGVTASWFETTDDDPGAGQTAEAIDRGADIVAVCGGDGTVRASLEPLSGTDSALVIIPAGTGNLLARNLGIPSDPADAIAVALRNRRRTLDIGYANEEAFAVMAGAGLDAEVMEDTSRESKDRLGSLAYVKTALEHLGEPRIGCVVTVDGTRVFDGSIATILAANHGTLQGGVDLFPDSAPDDGILDFLAISARSTGEWLRSAVAVVTGGDGAELVERWSGKAGVVELAEPTPYEIDGDERAPTSRLEFRVDRQALSVCVPEETP
jgi:diacylglycerol kinase (ATP)